MRKPLLVRSLEDGSLVLSVVHLERAECEVLERL